jgi:hypothetical protein
MIARATDFLGFHPDASGRLLAGMALSEAEEVERSIEVLGGVAHDLNAAPIVRTDAFHALLSDLAKQDRWEDANRNWQTWRLMSRLDLHRPDGRVDAWQARLLRHGGGQVG